MRNFRIGAKVAVGCLIACGGFASAQPAKPGVTAQQMLAYRPKQDAVVVTTPSDAELPACKVDVVKGANNTSAYVLRDARGQIVRRFADTKGTGKVDTKSYYLDGQEVYREIDTNNNMIPDQFRWFGQGGMRGASMSTRTVRSTAGSRSAPRRSARKFSGPSPRKTCRDCRP